MNVYLWVQKGWTSLRLRQITYGHPFSREGNLKGWRAWCVIKNQMKSKGEKRVRVPGSGRGCRINIICGNSANGSSTYPHPCRPANSPCLCTNRCCFIPTASVFYFLKKKVPTLGPITESWENFYFLTSCMWQEPVWYKFWSRNLVSHWVEKSGFLKM